MKTILVGAAGAPDPGAVCVAVVAALAVAGIAAGSSWAGRAWVSAAPLPVPRSEVASAVLDGRIAGGQPPRL